MLAPTPAVIRATFDNNQPSYRIQGPAPFYAKGFVDLGNGIYGHTGDGSILDLQAIQDESGLDPRKIYEEVKQDCHAKARAVHNRESHIPLRAALLSLSDAEYIRQLEACSLYAANAASQGLCALTGLFIELAGLLPFEEKNKTPQNDTFDPVTTAGGPVRWGW